MFANTGDYGGLGSRASNALTASRAERSRFNATTISGDDLSVIGFDPRSLHRHAPSATLTHRPLSDVSH